MTPAASLPQCIHIGLAKTGTTSLQKVLFSRHPDILYLGKVWSDNEALMATMADATRAPDRRLPTDWLDAVAKPQVARAIEAGAAGRKLVMFSEEDLTTHRFIDPGIAAARMKALLPEAMILLVLRDPLDWLQSMYFFRLSLRFPEALDGFDAWVAHGLGRPTRGTDVGQLHVAQTLDAYARLFGESRIRIRFYEDMRKDAERFVAELAQTLGVDPAQALAAYNAGGEGRFEKSRVTQARRDFLLSFRMVRDGDAAGYVESVRAMLGTVQSPLRARAETMLRSALDAAEPERTKQLRDASVFLDRVLRERLDQGSRATADATEATRRAVLDVVGPGLRSIAERFGVPADHYLEAAWAKAA